MKIGSLFSGYRGLDWAAEQFFGARTAWWSDIDPGAILINRHHWPDQPNLGDITRINWATVEPVNILTGGFPCQDLSHAGKRAGMRPDTRSGLWTHMAYAISQLRPRYVVAENVRGLLSASADSDLEPCPWCLGGSADGEPALRALGSVLGDLAELGYDARWCGLRAADVGAPHGRFRVFVLAADTSGDRRWPGARPGKQGAGRISDGVGRSGADPADASGEPWGVGHGDDEPARLVGGPDAAIGGAGHPAAADSERLGEPGRRDPRDVGGAAPGGVGEGLQRQRDRLAADDSGAVAADAQRGGRSRRTSEQVGGALERASVGGRSEIAWGQYEPAIRRWEHILGRPAPAPTEPGPKGGQRLSPRFVEFMMGLPAGWVTDVPGLTRNTQLKALGNGVVPQQAYAALCLMADHLEQVAS